MPSVDSGLRSFPATERVDAIRLNDQWRLILRFVTDDADVLSFSLRLSTTTEGGRR